MASGVKPWKGSVNFGSRVWVKMYLQKGSTGVFWGSAQVLHLIGRCIPDSDVQVSSTCCKRNIGRMKLTKDDKRFRVQIVPPQFLT